MRIFWIIAALMRYFLANRSCSHLPCQVCEVFVDNRSKPPLSFRFPLYWYCQAIVVCGIYDGHQWQLCECHRRSFLSHFITRHFVSEVERNIDCRSLFKCFYEQIIIKFWKLLLFLPYPDKLIESTSVDEILLSTSKVVSILTIVLSTLSKNWNGSQWRWIIEILQQLRPCADWKYLQQVIKKETPPHEGSSNQTITIHRAQNQTDHLKASNNEANNNFWLINNNFSSGFLMNFQFCKSMFLDEENAFLMEQRKNA